MPVNTGQYLKHYIEMDEEFIKDLAAVKIWSYLVDNRQPFKQGETTIVYSPDTVLTYTKKVHEILQKYATRAVNPEGQVTDQYLRTFCEALRDALDEARPEIETLAEIKLRPLRAQKDKLESQIAEIEGLVRELYAA